MTVHRPIAAAPERRRLLAAITALAAGAALPACTRLQFLAVNLPARFGAYERRADIRFGPHARHRADLYLPAQPASRAILIFWHGGRWQFGDKTDYRFVGATLAKAGFTTVIPNYRFYPEVKLAGFMDDAARAAEWVRSHAAECRGDAEKIIFMGHSAGAHIAVMLAVNRSYLETRRSPLLPAGVIGLSGPYDFLPIKERDLQQLFGPPQDWPLSQPIRYVTPQAPPALLIYGGADRVVDPANSVHMAAALESAGVKVTLKRYARLSHEDTVAALSQLARGRAPVLEDVEQFVLGRA
jgi:acetyl esterase/lipase